MPQTENNTKDDTAKNESEPKRFVSDTGQYLFDDDAGKLFKQWREMIRTAIRLPTNPSDTNNADALTPPPPSPHP
jgi:hypothetical protein